MTVHARRLFYRRNAMEVCHGDAGSNLAMKKLLSALHSRCTAPQLTDIILLPLLVGSVTTEVADHSQAFTPDLTAAFNKA